MYQKCAKNYDQYNQSKTVDLTIKDSLESLSSMANTFELSNLCKRDVGFNDVERVARFMSSYHPDDIGVIVTNKNYSNNSYDQAPKMNVIICFTQNLIINIMEEVERKKKKIAKNNDELKEIHVEVEVEVEDD
ncbi:24851_t:CDS:2 [Racocetra persica]|uniref:24851_t:CDS:1 n=1 Tax=Racocetra persica TaxID=160502 RepID=A0ACA9KYR2_9GLOM|nr:24851_t:CDS:2 [Racocetra persica]